jgi:phospholipid/cholesterol/gamma-HCH transport system permease protein
VRWDFLTWRTNPLQAEETKLKVMNESDHTEQPRRRRVFSRFLEKTGSLTVFSLRFIPNVLLPPYELGEVRRHLDDLGSKSIPLAGITGFIVGLIIAMQTRPTLFRFGADSYLPAMVAISFVRELGPVITALIVAGRVSSGIGA